MDVKPRRELRNIEMVGDFQYLGFGSRVKCEGHTDRRHLYDRIATNLNSLENPVYQAGDKAF